MLSSCIRQCQRLYSHIFQAKQCIALTALVLFKSVHKTMPSVHKKNKCTSKSQVTTANNSLYYILFCLELPFPSTPINTRYKSLHVNPCKLHGRLKLTNTRYVTFHEKLAQNQSFKEVKIILVKKKKIATCCRYCMNGL